MVHASSYPIARALVVLGLLAASAAPSRLAHAEGPADLARAQSRARTLELSHSTAWLRLGLYENIPVGGGWMSQVDGPSFFLSPRGRQDPDAELQATLEALFRQPLPGRENEHASCMFPARRRWLAATLAPLGLPQVRCPSYDEYVATIDANAVSFVYASSYIENPASAFGHTFLRIARKGSAGDANDYGVDYTARTDTSNPFLYAFKGLAGLFPGHFRFLHYDAMLRDYAALEARDLWEYRLGLSPSEVELLVAHLWELANAHVDYHYLTENCSYQIIAALDAAAPRLSLLRSLRLEVVPIDAVKAVYASPGLVREVVYRPSVRSIFRASLQRLDGRWHYLVARLVVDPDTPLPSELSPLQAALVLESAKLAIDASHTRDIVEDDPDIARVRERLLARRAAITSVPPLAAMPIAPRDKAPHESHGSMRLSFGSGLTTQYGSGFLTLGGRIALHDLADPPNGEPELLQLQFLDTRVRFDERRNVLSLETLTFAEVEAINPMTRFEKKLSWRLRAFGARLHDRAAPDAFAHGPDVALGAAVGTDDDRIVAFGMANAYAAFSGQIDGIAGSFVRVGIGPLAGVRARLPFDTLGLLTGNVSYLPAQPLDLTFDVRATLRTRLSTSVALGLEGSAQPSSRELVLASFVYF